MLRLLVTSLYRPKRHLLASNIIKRTGETRAHASGCLTIYATLLLTFAQ